ncbi:MAG: stage II sporulation protein R [Ruminococcaceae bacterium]|nr:stage II sporulation protein R [Oscillospiraceae bacterium]
MKTTSLVIPIFAIFVAFCIILFSRADAAQNRIANSLTRFHVIANSDLPWDQELKLKVRDAVVQYAESVTRAASNKVEAEATLKEHLPDFERIANAVLQKEGASYTAYATFSHRYFPTKAYAGFRLPAGDYDAVSIILGNGQGRNFWCVLFPPLCVTPVSITDANISLSDADISVITEDDPEIRYRFFLMELCGKITHKISRK